MAFGQEMQTSLAAQGITVQLEGIEAFKRFKDEMGVDPGAEREGCHAAGRDPHVARLANRHPDPSRHR